VKEVKSREQKAESYGVSDLRVGEQSYHITHYAPNPTRKSQNLYHCRLDSRLRGNDGFLGPGLQIPTIVLAACDDKDYL